MVNNNTVLEKVTIGNVVIKLIIRFIYIFLLFTFFQITYSYVMGIGGFDKIFNLQNIFSLSMVLILAIAFTLSTWKWYIGGVFAAIVAFFVNSGLGMGPGFSILMFTLFETPIFLGIATIIYFINKGYEKIPKRWLQLTIAGLPFIIFLLLLILASLTCSFGNNSVCVAKGTSGSDVTACRKSASLTVEMDCYKEFAKKLNDLEACNNIEGSQYYEMCLGAFILEKGENIPLNACDSAPKEKINTCYAFLGIAKKDPAICEKITWPQDKYPDEYNKYRCYEGIVWSGGDKALCDKILNDANKRSCLNQENMGYYDYLKK